MHGKLRLVSAPPDSKGNRHARICNLAQVHLFWISMLTVPLKRKANWPCKVASQRRDVCNPDTGQMPMEIMLRHTCIT